VSELRVIGTSQRKLDGKERVMGRTAYASDLRLPGMLAGKILRSPHPHARIRSVDVAAAERHPGVVAVVHAGNVRQRPFGYGADNVPLKGDRVRCVGDEVAAVAAETEEAAERALELIEVDYEVLPAVFDPFAALDEDAPAVHPERDDVRGCHHVYLAAPGSDARRSRHAMVIHPGWFDRSPCGTGTSARMAQLHARGELALDTEFVNESFLGTRFIGCLTGETEVGGRTAVLPTITGRAWITGTAQYLLDPSDPFPAGFQL